ncbi:MAG: malate synthase A, partial [Acidobacteriota bacterium]|nr:malate synthase A [Acidobacteriota bacterium]
NIFAMGGMAAQIPIKNDPAANDKAFAKVRADKEREATDGHDGTWVAHPGLVPVAKTVFDEHMKSVNQIERKREDVRITRDDLLRLPEGVVTEKGVRQNINVGILYLAAWLGGSGAVPLYNLMEDAATAEISRTQLWQWIHHRAKLNDGRTIDAELYRRLRDEEVASMEQSDRVARAARIFDELILANELADFLTLPAYAELLQLETNDLE